MLAGWGNPLGKFLMLVFSELRVFNLTVFGKELLEGRLVVERFRRLRWFVLPRDPSTASGAKGAPDFAQDDRVVGRGGEDSVSAVVVELGMTLPITVTLQQEQPPRYAGPCLIPT
jgi:hypothetical protein